MIGAAATMSLAKRHSGPPPLTDDRRSGGAANLVTSHVVTSHVATSHRHVDHVEAVLTGRLADVPKAPSNTVKIYVCSTSTGERQSPVGGRARIGGPGG